MPTTPVACSAGQVGIPAGEFRYGSSREERDYAYTIGSEAARRYRWYDQWEETPGRAYLPGYCIDRTLVAQRDYARFVSDTGARPPGISAPDYQNQGFLVHPYSQVTAYLWHDGRPPRNHATHPVVLVSRDEARTYCRWWGHRHERRCDLPSERQWEKAMRGTDGRWFPWGNGWDSTRANYGNRYGGTTPVTEFSAGASPFGVLDPVGNVFEWTQSDFAEGRVALRGCSWDDAPGLCRPAARHGRPPQSRHILFGFRCACD